ncbi:MAG: MarR family winged helix-turn-helix transcriptional regulator [Candidatus Limivicinus sp.]|jgi:DNA-binding MarR family transcriptional regulator
MDTREQKQILEMLHAVNRAHRAWKAARPETGINKSQFFTLMTLRRKGRAGECGLCGPCEDPMGPMTLSALARAMDQTMPALSQRISQLEALGYVERSQDTADRRTVLIRLTESGEAVLRETGRNMFLRMGRIIAYMEERSPGSAERLIDSFELLTEALELEFSD